MRPNNLTVLQQFLGTCKVAQALVEIDIVYVMKEETILKKRQGGSGMKPSKLNVLL